MLFLMTLDRESQSLYTAVHCLFFRLVPSFLLLYGKISLVTQLSAVLCISCRYSCVVVGIGMGVDQLRSSLAALAKRWRLER